MQAVADSNLSRMAELWGTAGRPRRQDQTAADYERRIVVMQAYLRNDDFTRSFRPRHRRSEGRQDRAGRDSAAACTWSCRSPSSSPVTSWLVNQVDLTAAGNPARPCVPGGQQDTTAAPE